MDDWRLGTIIMTICGTATGGRGEEEETHIYEPADYVRHAGIKM